MARMNGRHILHFRDRLSVVAQAIEINGHVVWALVDEREYIFPLARIEKIERKVL